MSSVRPASRNDVPTIAALWMRSMRDVSGEAPVDLQDYFAKIYFENPWVDLNVTPLVHTNQRKVIDGFIGLSARPMTLNGRSITAAVSSGLFVAPESRGRGIGLQLRRESFKGPHGLTFCDGVAANANDIWIRGGGELCELYSFNWTRVLQPAGYFERKVLSRTGITNAGPSPVAALVDFAGVRIAAGPYRFEPSDCRSVIAKSDEILKLQDQMERGNLLSPRYDRDSLDWILRDVSRVTSRGSLRKVIVLDARDSPVGWFVYYARRNGRSMILQIGAKPSCESIVLNRLINDARLEGTQALYGQFDARFRDAMVEHRCEITASTRFFFHTQDSEIRDALHSGRTSLSWLDGEWWMHFADGPW